ncbi:MAG: DUF1800 family protein [Candidatus Binatia bacterium]|nr:DUF1800 family protein [Candidatus Binatia bacterium]
MGDENTALSVNEVRHVMRRTGFGAPPKDLGKLLKAVNDAPTRGNLADELLGYKPKLYKPGGKDPYTAHNKWISYLQKPKSPLQSKLVLFWHDHFATQASAVGDTKLLARQIRMLHEHAKGNFRTLVKEVNLDAAMMEMLDTVRNKKAIPNENYSRELQELFSLGVDDLAGNPNYTQADVSQIARAFTGWDYDYPKGTPDLDTDDHDYEADFPLRGPKVIFQTTGGFGPAGRDFTAGGEGEAEVDTVTDILFDHTDTDGENTVARRITRRLLRFFCHEDYASPGAAEIATIDQIISDANFTNTWDLQALYRTIFVHDVFFETSGTAPYGAGTKKAIKWPVDYFISTLRLTGMKLKSRDRRIFGGAYDGAFDHLTQMGQVLLEPPSVFGWDWDTAWISSSTLLARYRFARDIVAARDAGAFRPDKLIDTDLTDPGEIVDAVSDSLGVPDQVTVAERQVYIDYLTDNGANPTIDLDDDDVLNTKLHGLYALVMQSPAYQLH